MRKSSIAKSAAIAFICTRRSEEHTSELQSQSNLVCRLLLEKKKKLFRFGLQALTLWIIAKILPYFVGRLPNGKLDDVTQHALRLITVSHRPISDVFLLLSS